ncbi:MAG: CBS domain-containing protein [Planctomycetes bacterium]|nr:CBS domain-containing protein [Planctomycetota bacterium]
MICPSCGHENIDGTDSCEGCQADLMEESAPRAATRVEEKIMEMPVSRVAARKWTHLPPTASLREAIQAMKGEESGAVLVVDSGNRLVGILTERDVFRRIAGNDAIDLDKARLSEHATRDPETIRPTDTLQYALNRMAIQGFRHLPLEGPGGPAGVVCARHVMDFIEDSFHETVTSAFRKFSRPE